MPLFLCPLGFYCLLGSLSFQCSVPLHQGLWRLFECLSFQCSYQSSQGLLRLFACLSFQCSCLETPLKGVQGVPLKEDHQSDCFDASHQRSFQGQSLGPGLLLSLPLLLDLCPKETCPSFSSESCQEDQGGVHRSCVSDWAEEERT